MATILAVTGHAQTAPVPGKRCMNAMRKIDRESAEIAANAERIARDRDARAVCSSRRACARLDGTIDDAERKQARRELRLARFREEASAACGTK
ncbi:MAG: hypothetical protein IT521_15300 [Burkholderiales bacterium]|nr:hypothetical protein [Burkholderiales bacterium]